MIFSPQDTQKPKSLKLLSWFKGGWDLEWPSGCLAKLERTDPLSLHPGLTLFDTNPNNFAGGGHGGQRYSPCSIYWRGDYGMIIFSPGPGRKQMQTHIGHLEEGWAGSRETKRIRSLMAGRVGCEDARGETNSWNMGKRDGCVERAAWQDLCWMEGPCNLWWVFLEGSGVQISWHHSPLSLPPLAGGGSPLAEQHESRGASGPTVGEHIAQPSGHRAGWRDTENISITPARDVFFYPAPFRFSWLDSLPCFRMPF